MNINNDSKSSVFIVTGMHRSGTSLTASLFQKVGVDIGKKLVGPADGNIKGHFENVDFVEFHKSVLRSHGIDELGCTFEKTIPVAAEFVEIAKKLIAENQQTDKNWGWKDPRTALFSNFWLNLLPEANLICVYRSPWEVVDSLYRRGTDVSLLNNPEMAVKMWIHYNQQVLELYERFPDRCLLANVYPIGNHPEFFINQVNQKFNVNLCAIPTDNFDKSLLVNDLENSHRHSLIEQYFPEAVEIYQILESQAQDLSSKTSLSPDTIITLPTPAVGQLQDWLKIRLLEKQQKTSTSEVKKWQEEFQKAQTKVLGLETELGQTQVQLVGKESQFEDALKKLLKLETELGQTQVQLAGKESQFQEALAKLLELETELGQTQVQLAGKESQFQEALAKLLELETELGQTQVQLAGKESNFKIALEKVLILESELGEKQAEIEEKELELKKKAAKFLRLETETREIQENLRTSVINLEKSRQEIEPLHRELAQIKSSLWWRIGENILEIKRQVRDFFPRFIFSIDGANNLHIYDSDLVISGWAFHSQFSIKSVRAKIKNTIFTGFCGIERSDVAEAHSNISAAKNSGFRIELSAPPGRHEVLLEVQDAKGKWHLLSVYPLFVSTIQASFDTPIVWEQRPGQVLFAGWCCHHDRKIVKLTLVCGDTSVECAYGLRRKDVGEVFPEWVNSSESGFEALVNVPVGEWLVSLDAELETGEILSFQASQILKVQPYDIWRRSADKFEELSRFIEAIRQRAKERKQRLGRIIPMPWEILSVVRQFAKIYSQQQQFIAPGELLPPAGFVVPQPIDRYDAWLSVNQWNERSRSYLISRLESCQAPLPKISVVMPVYNPEVEFLSSAIGSVCNQVYQNWELCIADDCSTDLKVIETLKNWATKDTRIQLTFRQENGNISAATNSALAIATGEIIVFLDNDDELTLDALGEVALYFATNPTTDFLYSDDDKIDTKGSRFSPQFKPEWSPELLLSYMYLGHLCAVRKQIIEQIGGMRLGFEGSQDYDFALRATEISRHVAHLPLVLYHWRTAPGSTAISGAAKPASFSAGQKAIQDALNRQQIQGEVAQHTWAIKENLGIFAQNFPDTGPSVTIIIPTKNQQELLKSCLDSLEATTYKNYQILVIDNESDDPKALEYFKNLKCQVLPIKNQQGKFSYAAINNRAVEQCDSQYILFLNNDTEIINPRWLSQMVGYAQIAKVGAVGARLLYPDNRVQHAGIIHGLHHGLAGHAFKLMSSDNRGYLSQAMVTRNYSAVTAACMLTPRQLFLELGGFDEANFAVAYNDADYGYRLLENGYRCVYCPDAALLHKEGASRGFNDNPTEVAAFRRKYAGKKDSCYSPHLSLEDEYFHIQPRRVFMKENRPLSEVEGFNDPSTSLRVQRKPNDCVYPVKVLMCSNSLDFTGAPLHQYEIAVKLAALGVIKPIVFCVSDGPLRQTYEQQGIEVIIYDNPLEHIYQRDAYDEAIENFSQEIKKLKVDAIYANTLENFFVVDAAQQIGIPTVWNVHESEPWQTYFNRFGSEIAARALECFRFPYKVIFVADATRDRYLPLNSHHNFTVIHNGLDLSRLDNSDNPELARKSLGVEEEDVVILVLGTVCERKGQQDLVKALALVAEEWHDKIRCFIVGDRPSIYSNKLAELVSELPQKLRRRVTIVPETSETGKYYQAADIFVCTSRVESFPRVILEAMAWNLPIITTPVFGIKEQVRPGINGLFYTPDRPEELAASLHTLLEDKSWRQRLAENAKYVLKSLNTFEEMTQDYGQIFREAYFTKK
ncbi:MAG: glycosyltransferase [Oscillatoriales cyanobacterium]|uniref:Glycosyltransferase n=2 Tax=Microcoleus TaxID=44471 RepID=A0ABU8YIE5_9CYAN|nr:MAG: glycosyltransferase [Oscillatoriales cyanobacterium]TAD98283.1 MAG: glycosyltransferase [Oscillatoriales cyanobacterium]TAF05424.1 MAG: glycosyltransferase [Oscillatoriales cyanobacterium]TAF45565.1 MAG: glycosyltransferase [Oscillatoriales cyanobacterium]TAF65520.1 MAG: glycosyltransferase [Oscillatoriales cyanobacterium]